MVFIALYFTWSVCASYPVVLHIKREEVVYQLAVTGGDALVEAEHCFLNIRNAPNAAVKSGAIRR